MAYPVTVKLGKYYKNIQMLYACSTLYVKKTTGIDANLTLLGERSNCHHDKLNSLERRKKKQEAFNHHMEAKMLDLEGMIEGQADHIAELEDEVAILRLRKECKCGGVAGSALGSGSAEDPINLEYADEEDSSLGGSYHTPPRVVEEPLWIFGSPISQHLPDTGGKGSITQWVHGEFMVISETTCSHFTQWAHSEHF